MSLTGKAAMKADQLRKGAWLPRSFMLRKGAWPRKPTSCHYMPVAFYAAWLPRSFTLPGTWTKSLLPKLPVTPSCPPEPSTPPKRLRRLDRAKAGVATAGRRRINRKSGILPDWAGRLPACRVKPEASLPTRSLPQAADRLSFRRSGQWRCEANTVFPHPPRNSPVGSSC